MRATIIYVTGRPEPKLDWLIDGLCQQAIDGDQIELIVVDRLGRDPHDIGFRPCAPVVRIVSTTPKPTPWQGAQRLVPRDWWAVSNARNTGIVLATTDYLAFLDDRCKLMPGWMQALRTGHAERASVLAGTYEKVENDRVTRDHRWRSHPNGLSACGGGWLFGCSIALPLAWALEVNGFEEGVDGMSGEDYLFGMMLERRHRRIDFRPELGVVQDRSDGTSHHLPRRDKGVSPNDKSHAAIRRFGTRTRTEITPDLTKMRESVLRLGQPFPDVDPDAAHLDWFDGQPIKDMVPT